MGKEGRGRSSCSGQPTGRRRSPQHGHHVGSGQPSGDRRPGTQSRSLGPRGKAEASPFKWEVLVSKALPQLKVTFLQREEGRSPGPAPVLILQ